MYVCVMYVYVTEIMIRRAKQICFLLKLSININSYNHCTAFSMSFKLYTSFMRACPLYVSIVHLCF